MDSLILIGLLLTLYVLISPLVIFIRQRGLRRRVDELSAELAALKAARAAGPAPETPPEKAEPEEAAPPEPTEDEPKAPPAAARQEAPPSEPPVMWSKRAAPTPPPEKPGPPRRSFEEVVASQWMIWLGGLAVALSAVFLFRYAIDQGLLTPLTRVILGLVLGGLLLGAGEWVLSRPVPLVGDAVRTDYVPPALTASGLFAVFVSLYAAHALYGLLTPATAFVALGLTAYAGIGLALRQGWFVALLGISAGYLVPMLVESDSARAVPLFLYLFLLTAGALAVMVWRRWWWFAALTVLGALGWPLLWILNPWAPTELGVIGAYLVGTALLFGALSARLPVRLPDTPRWRWLTAILGDTSGLGFALAGVLLILLALDADYGAVAFAFLWLYGAVALALAAWRERLEGLIPLAAVVAVAAFAVWPQPHEITLPEAVQELGTLSAKNAFGPYVMPPEFYAFSRALWAVAGLFGLAGFAGLGRARDTAVWAGPSAAVPVLMVLIGYWRIGAFDIDVAWAVVALGLAAVMLAAATWTVRMTGPERRDLPLALYAAGCTAAVALALACLMREAWLTVAIALEVAALGWIWTRLRVAELRAVAIAIIAVVLIRLLLNPFLFEYDGGFLGVFSWVIYGYGLPAAAFFAAARLFSAGGRDPVVAFCEIAGAGLGFLMVALQLKLWTSGTITGGRWDLFDTAVQTAWWMVASAILMHRSVSAIRPWAKIAGQLLLAIAGLTVALGHVVGSNPLTTYQPAGSLPLLNLLGLAYLLPALLAFGMARVPAFGLSKQNRELMRAGAGVLVFVYLTLETRRSFWGSEMMLHYDTLPRNAEVYAYSAVWLVFALTLLALAIWRRAAALRYASLAVLIVTVAKVFLYDMSDLTGLFRVASFLGLGLVMIGIGHVYRRYVFTAGAEEPPAG